MPPARYIPDSYAIEAYLHQAAGFVQSQLVALGAAPDVAARMSESWRVGAAREIEQMLGMAALCVTPTPVAARRGSEP